MSKVLKLIFLTISLFSFEMFADIGKIVALRGEADALRNSIEVSLKVGMSIEKNDVILTKDNSKTQIIFKDETIVTIGKNSRFIVNDYLFEDKEKPKADFKFLKGSFKFITGKIGKINPNSYKLETKTASMGIRGTQIDMNLSDIKEFIKCTQGAIDVTILTTGITQSLKSGESISINIKNSQNENSSNNENSSETSQETKTDIKYDSWIEENKTVRKAVEDALDKGHTQGYDLTSIEGRINRHQNPNFENFDTSNVTIENSSTHDMTIDFGKGRNVNSVEIGNLRIIINGDNNIVRNLQGKINTDNEIELTYDTTTPALTDISATGTLKFKNTDLDVESQSITGLKTTAQDEEVEISDIQFKAK